MVKFLITLPEHDDLADYCSKWSAEILKVAAELSYEVKKLQGPDATRKNVEARISNSDTPFIMFNGHGDFKTVAGHLDEAVLSCAKSVNNEKLSKDKIIYVRACCCGAELGPACIRIGCKSFVGYEKDFAIIKSKNKTSRPMDDERAKPFFDISNQIPIAILKGNTVEEAVHKADIKLEKEIERLMTTETFLASHLIPWLLWNQKVRIVLGNEKAII